MIHTNRTITVGEQASTIDRPIVLYRGDREVEIEFTLVGNRFTFSEKGNVIKSVNASHGQLVLNTPSGENMFSELVECHEGKVVFVVTKEMIDELVEMGFYSFQIRLYDSAEMKSRVTIPPVMNGFDIRNPIAAEDETNVVDQSIVDYAKISKDQSDEELPTFTWDGEYVKTEWAHHDVINANKMNKIEDALYSINANVKESDVVMLNTLNNVKKDADKYVKEHMAEVEQDVEEFERNLNTDVQQFKIDTNVAIREVSNEVEDLEESIAYHNVNIYGVYGDGVTNYTDVVANIPDDKPLYFPPGEYILDTPPNNKCFGYGATLIVENGYIMRLDTKPLEVDSVWQDTIRLNNTDLGINAGKKLDASNYGNVAIGNNALQTAESRTIKNIAIGHNAIGEGTWLYHNAVVGVDACRYTTMGERNTIIGNNAGLSLGATDLVGRHYFYRTDIDVSELDTLWPEWREYVGSLDAPNIIPTKREDVKGNTAIGRNSLGWTIKPLYCTAIGYNALEKAADGTNMVSIGVNNSYNTIKAINTTSVGMNANVNCSTTFGDTSIGYGAMSDIPHGEYNTAIGYQSMAGVNLVDRNRTFNDNVAVGRFTISNSNNGVINNVAVGSSALRYTNGNNNVAIGYQALSNMSNDYNVAIGYKAANELTDARYATALGVNALNNKGCDGYTNITGVGSNSTVSGSNQVQLGNSSANPYTFNPLQLRSDERDKIDIVDIKIGLDFINALKPVEYRMNIRESYIDYDEHGEVINNVNDGSRAGKRKHVGLIAQDVKRVLDDIGVDYAMYQDHKVNGGKDVLSLGYEELIAPLIKAVQELTARINKLENGE